MTVSMLPGMRAVGMSVIAESAPHAVAMACLMSCDGALIVRRNMQ